MPPGVGVLTSFLPGGGKFAHQKVAGGFAVRLEILSKVITKKTNKKRANHMWHDKFRHVPLE